VLDSSIERFFNRLHRFLQFSCWFPVYFVARLLVLSLNMVHRRKAEHVFPRRLSVSLKVEQAIDVSQTLGHLSFLLPATSPMISSRLLGGENHIDVIKQT
jgi:hypothetical protein